MTWQAIFAGPCLSMWLSRDPGSTVVATLGCMIGTLGPVLGNPLPGPDNGEARGGEGGGGSILTCVAPAHAAHYAATVPVAAVPAGGGLVWADADTLSVGVVYAPSTHGQSDVFAAPGTVPVGDGGRACQRLPITSNNVFKP
jgi:hypothetical protein